MWKGWNKKICEGTTFMEGNLKELILQFLYTCDMLWSGPPSSLIYFLCPSLGPSLAFIYCYSCINKEMVQQITPSDIDRHGSNLFKGHYAHEMQAAVRYVGKQTEFPTHEKQKKN